MNEILKVTNLNKAFTSANENLVIIKNLNLSIEAGMTVSITGSSGSGKSTLLNMIGGLEKVDSGEIIAGDFNVSESSEEELTLYRQKFLGFVFQFHYLLKDFSTVENVMIPALIAGVDKNTAREKAMLLLADVNLDDRAEQNVLKLSGGERQRVAVARALINEPALILADEPTGNLDPTNAAVVRNLLFSVVQKHHKALIVVSHDIEGIAKMTDICYNLENGKLVQV
ncbi:MAG: ABC transporter ATP-binding protein [Treponemataceae bacterium]